MGGSARAVVPHAPERVGRYEILLPIASGGMATVYLARARGVGGFEQDVALKVTHAHLRETSEFVGDLLEEAKLASRVRHRNVVSVLDVGDDPHGVFLVMEYVEGDTLAGLRKRTAAAGGALPVPIAARVLIDALAGLHAAHELRDDEGRLLGLVHRDFSPQNLLVGLDGHVKLTDFGIAKAAGRLGHTRSGLVKGKIAYMAPEQAKGTQIDRRCDVWAAGIVAWEVFAGRRLYPNSDDVATLLKIVSEPPARLRTVVQGISPQLDEAVARALSMNAEERTPSAMAFARELTAACRATGELAETSEVADFMAHVVGPKLSDRRRAVSEIVSLRTKVGQLAASTDVDGTGATPRSEVAVRAVLPSEPPTIPIASIEPEAPIESAVFEAAPAEVVGGALRPPVPRVETDPPTGTDTTSVASEEPSFVPRRRARLAYLAVGCAIAVVAAVATWRYETLGARERTHAPAIATPSPAEAPRRALPSAPATTQTALASANANPTATATTTPSATASPIASATAGQAPSPVLRSAAPPPVTRRSPTLPPAPQAAAAKANSTPPSLAPKAPPPLAPDPYQH